MSEHHQATKSRTKGPYLPGCARPLTEAELSCLNCQVPGDCNDRHPLCTYHTQNNMGKWDWLVEKAKTIAPDQPLTIALDSPRQLPSARGAIYKRAAPPPGYKFTGHKKQLPGTDTLFLEISLVPSERETQ